MRNTTHSYLLFLLVGFLIPAVFLSACSTSEKKLNREYSTRYFSLSLPQNYVLDESQKKDEDDGCEMIFRDRETYKSEGWSFWFSITAKKQTAAEYRRQMLNFIDLKKYSMRNLPVIPVGGKDFIMYTPVASQGESLFYRDEASGLSIWIESSPRALFLAEILESIKFTFPDLGLKDPNFPWNLDPVKVKTSIDHIGNCEFEVKQYFFVDRIISSGGKNLGAVDAAYHVAASRSYLYTYDAGRDELTAYRIHGDKLDLDTSAKVEGDFYSLKVPFKKDPGYVEVYTPCDNGLFLVEHLGGEEKYTLLPLFGSVGVHPYENMVLTYHENTMQVYKQELVPEEEFLDYSDWSFILHLPSFIPEISDLIYVTQNYIIMQSPITLGDTIYYDAHVFNLDGNYLMTLEGKNGYAYDFCEVNGHILGLYNYPARIVMWDKLGKFEGQLDQERLFGFEFPENDDQPVSMCCVATNPLEVGQTELMMLITHYVYGVPEVYAFRIIATSGKD